MTRKGKTKADFFISVNPHHQRYLRAIFFVLFFVVVFFSFQCGNKKDVSDIPLYASLNDTVKYVGMQMCRQCHADKFETFMHTGMGMSFDHATQKKSSARFGNKEIVYDSYKDFYYHPYFSNDSLFVHEYRLKGKDTIHSRTEQINYIVGSGQHTNSHIMNVNGYLHQAPVTFYTQRGKWDLPPGFENGNSSRFSRKIELECISCHNGYPQMVDGSENKYTSVPNGIDCERCHGPGEQHVKEKMAGKTVDVTKEIDYTIVNPAKLSVELQLDVCQRCHIQGNAVLKPGKSFFDFRPGMKLSSVMNVFMPKYAGANEKHIMASHAERLKMSRCFIVTNAKANAKNPVNFSQQASFTCITYHNPHVSVKVTDKNIFNDKCKSCHGVTALPVSAQELGTKSCTEKIEVRNKVGDNCYSCHMPQNHTTDIPHVITTDHFIRKPLKEEEIKDIREFIGITCINNPEPPQEAIAEGYLSLYEKFTPNPLALDSAKKYLPDDSEENIKKNFSLLVRWAFLKNDYQKVIAYVSRYGNTDAVFKKIKYNNDAAWTAYRIGESFLALNNNTNALNYFSKAVVLEPYNFEFRNKLGALQMKTGKQKEAAENFMFIYNENPKYVPAITNLGYYYLSVENNAGKAEQLYHSALSLDPDNEQALLNMAGLYMYRKDFKKAKQVLESLLKKVPGNMQAQMALKQIEALNN